MLKKGLFSRKNRNFITTKLNIPDLPYFPFKINAFEANILYHNTVKLWRVKIFIISTDS